VVPPTAPPRTPLEYVDGEPIGAGFRVPCIIVSPWTQGGWIASQVFDHTFTLQFLELITGVAIPNLGAWRRATFGSLTSALGFPVPSGPPRLPNTKAELALAVYEVSAFPAPQIPGAEQTFPVQLTGRRPWPRGAALT
jgi:phospholipase C